MDAAYAAGASWLPEEQRGEARNLVEAIGNLLYLIQVDSEDGGLVRSYTSQAEERLRVLAALISDSSPRPAVKGPKVQPISNNSKG